MNTWWKIGILDEKSRSELHLIKGLALEILVSSLLWGSDSSIDPWQAAVSSVTVSARLWRMAQSESGESISLGLVSLRPPSPLRPSPRSSWNESARSCRAVSTWGGAGNSSLRSSFLSQDARCQSPSPPTCVPLSPQDPQARRRGPRSSPQLWQLHPTPPWMDERNQDREGSEKGPIITECISV